MGAIAAGRDELYDAEDKQRYQAHVGQLRWIADTTHPTLSVAASILGSFASKPGKGCLEATRHAFRWLQGVKTRCLKKMPGFPEGLYVASDSDLAGLYQILGGKRSRSGSAIFLNGFLVAYDSRYQKCKATEYKDEDEVALSSGAGEVYALSDTIKLALHVVYCSEELGINISKPFEVHVDAAAAIGFCNAFSKTGKMKYIDLRESWVRQLRDRGLTTLVKVDGLMNVADFFTKILGKTKFQQFADWMMGGLEENRGAQ